MEISAARQKHRMILLSSADIMLEGCFPPKVPIYCICAIKRISSTKENSYVNLIEHSSEVIRLPRHLLLNVKMTASL